MEETPWLALEQRLESPHGSPESVDSGGTAIAALSTSDRPIGTTDSEGRSRCAEISEDCPDAIPPLFPIPQSTGGAAKWFWLVTLASVGLHTGLMLIPTGEASKPLPPKASEQQVRITQLSNPAKQPTVKPSTPPVVKVTPAVVTRSPVIALPPVVQASPSPQSTPAPPDSAAADNPWKDFPLYPGSTPGCFGLPSCLAASVALSQVSAHFANQLPARKYDVKRTVQASGREVYQVARNGLSQYLSLIETGKNTVYVLADAPRTLEDLEKAVEVPPEILSILVSLAVQKADATDFSQPEQFYSKADGKSLSPGVLVPRSHIRNISLVTGQVANTMMDEFLRSNLQNNAFDVTDLPQEYGSGPVYQLQKANQILYLNLVPTQDNSGTLLVFWKTPPG
jgi:hypothetical protein